LQSFKLGTDQIAGFFYGKYLEIVIGSLDDRYTGWYCYILATTNIVFNTTFNNISVIPWRSVLLVEEPGENHRSVASR
jgi:hypothetical protein